MKDEEEKKGVFTEKEANSDNEGGKLKIPGKVEGKRMVANENKEDDVEEINRNDEETDKVEVKEEYAEDDIKEDNEKRNVKRVEVVKEK